jgi:flagellar hook-associated protein 2
MSTTSTSLSSSASPNSTYDYSQILQAATGAATVGIDVTAAVQAAVTGARQPETVWQTEQTTLSTQTTGIGAIQTAAQNVANDLQSLNALTGPLATRQVSSSDSSAIAATAASGTSAGTHNVTVNSLASTGAWYSDLALTSGSTLSSTSFKISMANGQSATISTGSQDDTLSELASAVNAATGSNGKPLGLTASVITDDTGSRLAIVSAASGAANDFGVSSENFAGTNWTSPGLPSGESLGANSISVTVGGVATSFSTTAGETYSQLATAINAANIGVTATPSSSASGTSLTLASTNSSTSFSLNEPSFGFTQAQQGSDASLIVDGVPVSSASNTVTGAISGVTLDLLGTTNDVPATLTVASDASSASTAINQLVTDYNTAIGLVNSQFQFSTTTNSEGALASDPTIIALQSAMEQALDYTASPAVGQTTTSVSSLADLGLSLNTDGSLSADSTTLNNALVNNPGDVQNFFEGSALNGFAASMNNALNTYLDPGNGAFTLDLNSISATNQDLTQQISDFEDNYITPLKTELTANLGQAEAALQELPQQMAQINAELGLTGTKS